MLVTNQTSSDIYFGPLHLGPGKGATLIVDDTTANSLYLTDDSVADALNNAAAANSVLVSGAADPFPRPTGIPTLLHGTGDPEGLVFAPRGSLYMRRDAAVSNGGGLYVKTTGVTLSTGWVDMPTASGASAVLPTGAIVSFGGATAPDGWLACDGSLVSRTVFSLLFGVIGTFYGSGDGINTFALPDLRGRVAAGYAASGGHPDVSVLGLNEGFSSATNRRPTHNSTVNDPGHAHTAPFTGGGSGGGNSFEGTVNNPTQNQPINANTTGITVGPGGTAAVDTPAYLVINHIIKT